MGGISELALTIIFAIFILLNVYLTVITIKRGQDFKMKAFVTILIWWLPIIGATIALLVLPKKQKS